jgi:hypothetical protein
MTTQELKTKIAELQKELEKLEAKEWPNGGEEYRFVRADGGSGYAHWHDSQIDYQRKSMGIFRTKKEAQAEKMRRESMAQRGEMPEEGGEVYFWGLDCKEPLKCIWGFDDSYLCEYWIGSVKKTKEECIEWGAKYARYFERQ